MRSMCLYNLLLCVQWGSGIAVWYMYHICVSVKCVWFMYSLCAEDVASVFCICVVGLLQVVCVW